MNTQHISVDPRAGSKPLIKLLRTLAGNKSVVQDDLNSGDVAWTVRGPRGTTIRAGVEVKHLSDALACMGNGRFVSQLRKMHKDYDEGYRWLMIVDEFKARSDGTLLLAKRFGRNTVRWVVPRGGGGNGRREVKYTDFIEWLATICYQGGVMLWREPNDQQAAVWLYGQYKWASKAWDKHDSLRVFDTSRRPPKRAGGKVFFGKPNDVMKVAFALVDGIGWHKARAASRVFRSVDAFVAAGAGELMTVPGWGRVLADRMRAAVLKQWGKSTEER
jgi:hypothetical protein